MDIHQQLAIAIQVAANAHAGQFDKGGKPYILHPLHLMTRMLFNPQLATIAVLHDVLEDSEITIADLQQLGMSERVITALDLLCHRDGVPYEVYIEGICANYDAVRVKRKDLEHNTQITRLKGVRPKDLERIEKYHKAFQRLTEAKRAHESNLRCESGRCCNI